jgi:hypothetical protein
MRASSTVLKTSDRQTLTRTKVLADNVRDVAGELRLIDLADFVTLIYREEFANIQDLVNSSIELFFKHGTLTYGAMASFDLEWDHAPSITLGLEFQYQSVYVLFELMLKTYDAGIEIRSISFGDDSISEEEKTEMLVCAIAAARISKSFKLQCL